MEEGPSRTALSVAMHRAAHQRLDKGNIFADPFAVVMLPRHVQPHLDHWGMARQRRLLRAFIAYRSSLAEARLAEAAARGTRQVVVVGAGLDTLALRNPFPQAVLYEVDHPATQKWKRGRLRKLGIVPAPNVRFVPCNFEVEGLGEALARAGFDAAAPAYFSWLGVVPYLTDAAIFATLSFIASVPAAEVVFDYANPTEELPRELRKLVRMHAERAALAGEPFVASFNTAILRSRLEALGAVAVDDWGQRRMRGREGDNAGVHIVHARWP